MKRGKWLTAIGMAVVLTVSGVPMITNDVNPAWAATIPGTWIKSTDGRWWYKHTDGTYTKNNWEEIDGKWYYFDASGWMYTGWLERGGKWYYLNEVKTATHVLGEMVTGWQKDDGKWYYLNEVKTATYVLGEMLTGWQKVGGRYYYLNPAKTDSYSKGEMLKGWQKISEKWYYLNPTKNATFLEGERVTGWLTLNGKKYYMDVNGVRQTGELVMDGKKYTFNANGELISEEVIPVASAGDLIAQEALNYIDAPFKWNGNSLSTGCDNAGFLYCIMSERGYSIPEKIQEQQSMGKAVTQSQLRPGDVVIYSNESKLGAIYLGDNRVIYAASPRWGVRITTLQHPGTPAAFRRVW